MIVVLYFVLLLVPALFAVAYLDGFALARLCGKRVEHKANDHQTNFLLLIPAHDEELAIRHTLDSIASAQYADKKLTTIVIADNCSDRTAEIARECDFECLERSDETNIGKGFALAWGFEQIQDRSFDAVAIVDADCPVQPDLFEVLDGFFQAGADAVQANHLVSNADASPIAYAAAVGRALEYDLLYAAKSAFGLSVMLVGTGMAFRRTLLESVPWNSHTCAEDTEYTLELARHGTRVQFASNGYVHCTGATSRKELDVQRSRWAAGNIALGRTNSFGLIWNGLRRGRLLLIDLGVSLMFLSRPLLLAHAALTLFVGLTLYYLWPNDVHRLAAILASCLIPAYGLWIGLGIIWTGINRQRMLHLAKSPFVVLQLAWIAARSSFAGPNITWRRTPRA